MLSEMFTDLLFRGLAIGRPLKQVLLLKWVAALFDQQLVDFKCKIPELPIQFIGCLTVGGRDFLNVIILVGVIAADIVRQYIAGAV